MHENYKALDHDYTLNTTRLSVQVYEVTSEMRFVKRSIPAQENNASASPLFLFQNTQDILNIRMNFEFSR